MRRALFPLTALLFITACASNPKPQTAPGLQEEKPPEKATINVYPRNSVAGIRGTTVRIEFRIERHPDNRSFLLEWGDEGGKWGSTGKDLDGESAEVLFGPIFLDRLYPGNYTVTLSLVRSEEGRRREYRVRTTFTVL